MKITFKIALISAISVLLLSCNRTTKTAEVYLTSSDKKHKLEKSQLISEGKGCKDCQIISLDSLEYDQEIDGFGFALTQGSAEAIFKLNDSTRKELLNELFSVENGNGISILRISIGASDLSNSDYTWCDIPGDTLLAKFRMPEPDSLFLFPLLAEIKAINPEIKIMATPWTAPIWMKSNKSWIGGNLLPAYYSLYASYFIRFVQKMESLGLPVFALTIQNEPENPNNEPSMSMTADEQIDFIENHLGPGFAKNNISTKILAYDHNCDHPDYPIKVLQNTKYADGAAFHLYGGDISSIGKVREATGKNVFFTEQYTGTNGKFGGDLDWHMLNVVLGSLKNGAKTVIEWNLATNADYGPHTPKGCAECLGALTINSENTFTRNVSYYIISQASKVIKSGAKRLKTKNVEKINYQAFENPDGSIAVLVHYSYDTEFKLSLQLKKKFYNYMLDSKGIYSFSISK